MSISKDQRGENWNNQSPEKQGQENGEKQIENAEEAS
jgi:hypothetical protein